MDERSTPGERRQPFRDAGGDGAIVFDPRRLSQASPELFEPAHYAAEAQPVQGQGGRGAAWFVRGVFGAGVLRRYRRGGWAAYVSDDAYWWRGETEVRSLREFALLQRLRDKGLPVPAPIAAMYLRRGPLYRTAILVERIPDVRSFVDCVQADAAAAPWGAVGAAIGHCHRAGARHADLNAHNVLVDQARKPWLIDWDKGTMESAPGDWCIDVLNRLERSLRKRVAGLREGAIEQGMQTLRKAHALELGA
ncbi:3-deoxy-D-manno-octulosonic acid kinase [Arenimonas sp.]|uniref:3-deoxy-D-manno-octulosonic acid kinase n=1 Tax=Arenimonas sp. TaxID=1872635 RepID=UPI0039E5696F